MPAGGRRRPTGAWLGEITGFWDEIGRANYSYGWHTQKDRLDQAIGEYLVQSATNSAITAYNLANAPTLLPRAAPPEPTAPRGGGQRQRQGNQGE